MRLIPLLVLALSAARPALALTADETFEMPSVAAASWLGTEADAGILGLAGAGSATQAGLGAIGANPAGLGGLDSVQLGFSHQAFGDGFLADRLAVGLPLAGGGVGIAADYLSFGSASNLVDDGAGNITDAGSINPKGLAVAAGYGRKLGSVSVGLALRSVSDDPDGAGFETAFSGDLGLAWHDSSGLSVGTSLNQIGGTLFGSPMPTHGRLGLAYARGITENLRGMLALEQRVPTLDSNQSSTHAGLAVKVGGKLDLRTGYEHLAAANQGYLRAGVGAEIGGYRLDYAFAAGEEGDASHLISLGLNWDRVFGGPSANAPAQAAPLAAEPATSGVSVDQVEVIQP